MKKVRIGLPDGNGCFGTLEFWKQYFSDIGVEYVGVDDEEYKLEQYVRESNSIFPSSICVNSKYRLGRAIELADKVDYFLFFLREDEISNCMASIYRVEWIKHYFENVKCIVWKRDILPGKSDYENFVKLSEILTGEKNEEILREKKIPKRPVVYDISLRKRDRKKKTLMLIGVAPFFVDLYRKSDLMDYITDKVNLLNPTSIGSYGIKEDKYKLYKENTIINSIEKAEKHNLVDGYLFVGDAFDMPGKYSFPRLKKYVQQYSDKEILELIPGISNEEICRKQFDEFMERIEVR